MDDGNLLGNPDQLLKAWEILSSELPKIGLHLNPSKSEWITSSNINGPEGVPLTPKDELIILGVPLGSKEFCLSFLDRIILSNSKIAEKLSNLDDSQISLWLFRYGISLSSIVHLIRTIPATKIQKSLERFDYYVAYYFERIIGCSLDNNAKTQFRLPIRKGGFGLKSAVLHSEAAYKASHGIFLDPSFYQTQKMLSEILDNNLYSDFLANLDNEDQIRLKYCAEPHVGAWISAPPLPSFGLTLDHFNFQTLCKWWLGLNQPLAAEKCSLCYVNTTPKATHNLACKNGGDLIKRHNKLPNFIFHIAQQCGLNPVLEKKNILGDCDSGKRPADVLIPSWSLNKDYAIDVAITDPINGSFKLDMEA